MRLSMYSLQRHAEYAARLSTAAPQRQRSCRQLHGNHLAAAATRQHLSRLSRGWTAAAPSLLLVWRRAGRCLRGGAGWALLAACAQSGCGSGACMLYGESEACRRPTCPPTPPRQRRPCQPAWRPAQRPAPATILHWLIGSGRTTPAHPLLSIAFSPAPYPLGQVPLAMK